MTFKGVVQMEVDAVSPEEALRVTGGGFVSQINDGPGTELKKILARFGFVPAPGCKCNQRIQEMNTRGPDWCGQNIDVIVGWLREEADRAKLPFLNTGARLIVKRAISKARKAISA